MRILNIIFLVTIIFLPAGCAKKTPAVIEAENAPLQLQAEEVDYWMRIKLF